MKNKISTLIVFLSLIIFASCKKSYQCDCSNYTVKTNGQTQYVSTKSNTYKERKRADAQSACVAKSMTTTSDITTCTIIN